MVSLEGNLKDKGGRYLVAQPVLKSPTASGPCQNSTGCAAPSGRDNDTWWFKPETPVLERMEIAEGLGPEELGPPLALRSCQSHSLSTDLCPERYLVRLTRPIMDYLHSVTHRTDFSNYKNIMRHGLRPMGRTVHFPVSRLTIGCMPGPPSPIATQRSL